MKRLLICILIITLVFPFSIAVADGNPMRSLTLETEVNEDVLDVYFYTDMEYPNQTTAFESMDFVLSYASDVLKPIELVKSGDMPESDILDNSFIGIESFDALGVFEYHAASALGHQGSGLLLHLRFRILREGDYEFRLQRNGYSVYDSNTKQSTAYAYAFLRFHEINVGATPVPIPDLGIDSTETNENVVPEKNWFSRLMQSIFGASCTSGR